MGHVAVYVGRLGHILSGCFCGWRFSLIDALRAPPWYPSRANGRAIRAVVISVTVCHSIDYSMSIVICINVKILEKPCMVI